MRAVMIGLLAARVAQAQFTAIAASDNGSQMYVTTPFVISGMQNPIFPPTSSHIFQVGPGQASLLVQIDATKYPQAQAGTPQVSGDGSVVGYTVNLFCGPSLACGPQNVESFLLSPVPKDLGPGALQLSRNGQWALLVVPDNEGGVAPGVTSPPGSATLMNLQTGETASVPLPPPGAQAIASDGSLLTPTGIWKAGNITPVVLASAAPESFLPPALSDDASTIVYANFNQLIAHDVASGNETIISNTPPGNLFSLSATGRYVLYGSYIFSAGSLVPVTLVSDITTGQSYPIPLATGESMVAGVLNSSGTIAFITTSTARIVQATISSGQTVAVTEILPPVNYVSNLQTLFSPGSLTRLSASVASDAASLQGKLLMDGQAMPVVSYSGGTITAQVPWEVRTGSRPFQINLPSASLFLQASNVNVIPAFAEFEQAGARPNLFGAKFLTEDFSALAANPLPPGAILHAYLTGLGPVSGSAQTGVAAAAGALIPIQGALTCQFLPQSAPAQTLFAGLAPGLLGIYQVDLQLANEGTPVNATGINCTLAGPGFTVRFSATGPPPTP